MADDSDDTIYVDVKPRLDEQAADEAEQKLRDKFKDAAKDIGDNIKGAFENLGDHVKDIFSKDHIQGAIESTRDALGSDLGKEIVGDLRKAIEEELGYTANDALRGIGKSIGSSIREAIGGDTIDTVVDKAQKLTDTIHAIRSHDIRGGLRGASSLFGDVDELGGLGL